jgi:hypothetical protein
MAVIKGGNGRPTSFIDTWQPAASLHKPAVILQGMSPGLMVLYIITIHNYIYALSGRYKTNHDSDIGDT